MPRPVSGISLHHWANIRPSGQACPITTSIRCFHASLENLAKKTKRTHKTRRQLSRQQPQSDFWPNQSFVPPQISNVSHSNPSISSSSPTLSATQTFNYGKEKEVPLFEKLFPDHVTQYQKPLAPGIREAPRLALKLTPAMTELLRRSRSDRRADMKDKMGYKPSLFSHRSPNSQLYSPTPDISLPTAREDSERAILILSNTSSNLDRSDFERSQPSGKDLSWTRSGQFVQVIPIRQLPTLEKTGSYMVIFPTTADYNQYKQHLHSVHRLMTQHSPSAIISRLTPPPGYIQNDVDAYTTLQNFTVVPPASELYLRPFHTQDVNPNSRHSSLKNPINQIWRLGNYSELTSRVTPPKIPNSNVSLSSIYADPEWDAPKNREFQVLFWIEGRQPDTRQLAHSIRHQGTKRGKQWLLSNEREPIICVNRWRTHRPTRKAHSQSGYEEFSNEGSSNAPKDDERRHWEGPPKWRIAFATEDEAKRFARTWDGISFPWVNPLDDPYDSQALQRLKRAMNDVDDVDDVDVRIPSLSAINSAQRDRNLHTKNLDDLTSRVYAEYIWT